MISPVASDMYTVSAASIIQVTPRDKFRPAPRVEVHEETSAHSLRDEAVKVAISEETQDQIELLEGDKLPVEMTKESEHNIKEEQITNSGAELGRKSNRVERDDNDYERSQSTDSDNVVEGRSTEDEINDENGAITRGREAAEGLELSEEDERKVRELKRIDQEIRIHEQLHAAVGGPYTRGGPNFHLVLGPDGRQYAASGHVDIDMTEGATPEETIRKAAIIKAAATAPASPSSADLMIAAQAALMEVEARAKITQKMLNSHKSPEEGDVKPVQDRNMSDQLLSLLGAVPAPKINQILNSDKKNSSHNS